MTEIVTISRETPLEFIRRNGPTLTWEVANRFSLDQREALKIMKALEKTGAIKSKRVAYDIAAGKQWEMA
jgi:DNA-binding Lrp family transcriptional regulator